MCIIYLASLQCRVHMPCARHACSYPPSNRRNANAAKSRVVAVSNTSSRAKFIREHCLAPYRLHPTQNGTWPLPRAIRTTGSQQKPIILQGHERSLTQIVFNAEGDLLFSASKDNVVNVWYTSNGERLGTFNGHNGSVWTIACDCKCYAALRRSQMRRGGDTILSTVSYSIVMTFSLPRQMIFEDDTHPSTNQIPRYWCCGQHYALVGSVDGKTAVPMGVLDCCEAGCVEVRLSFSLASVMLISARTTRPF